MNKEKYMIASEKKWHDNTFTQLQKCIPAEWIRINNSIDLCLEKIDKINPKYIFFLHWSYIIPSSIYEKYNCVVFHMTDLPYGRGGSPLQNLIVRGHKTTKLSAIKVQKGIDTGDIYLKKDLSLFGTAEEIFIRAGQLMVEMIQEILEKKIIPMPQDGEPLLFQRRKSEDSDMGQLVSLEAIYDHIRMLDCEDYPSAFIENENFRFEFSRASFKNNKIIADVRITKK